jgi:hypothetical protein
VVGLNTSAFIDAAIIGRPSFAILPREFRDSQEGTLHFRHLLEAGGGLLTVADSVEEHWAQLSEVLEGRRPPVPHERFIEAFVRPRGVDVAATGAMADAIEALAAAGPRAVPRSLGARIAGLALALPLSEAIRWRGDGPPGRRQARRALRPLAKRLRRTRKRMRRNRAVARASAILRSAVPSPNRS